MAFTNCRECWVWMQTCCWKWNLCWSCKEIQNEEIRKQMAIDAAERQRKIDAWEIEPVNIASIDPQFCNCCWIPKNWCNCECKNKRSI